MTKKLFIALAILALHLQLNAGQVEASHASMLHDSTSPFKLNHTETLSKNTRIVHIRWQIGLGSYIYKHRVRIKTAPHADSIEYLSDAVVIWDENLEDNFEVFFKELNLDVSIPYIADGSELEVTIQGCSNKGVCFLPQTEKVDLGRMLHHVERGVDGTQR
ncbi:MAG: hypothetical protein EOO52_13015 [Gammaproteobacteria bacterium]|nr:MAG: hypothetical protein EOO52_13015 [Gammaproteobacteria bacterium]